MNTRPGYAACMELFALERGGVLLNHGSFGGTPLAVLEEQTRRQRAMEREPIRFFVETLEGELDAARRAMAEFVGCAADDFAFVANATEGVSTVVRSLALKPGDELLTNTHEYNACNNALAVIAERAGARVVRVELPFPVSDEGSIIDAVMSGVTGRTRLAMISHITSPTGIILPVEELVRRLAARGVDTLVDGAHAPGFMPLNVEKIGAAYYTGNFHKWVCAPKGSAFLYVRPDRQRDVRPLVISHGANATRTDRSRFRLEFDYTGCRDMSAFLATPLAAEVMGRMLPGGWPALMQANRALALRARDLLCAATGNAPPAPDRMLGPMAAVRIADRRAGDEGLPTRYHDALQDRLIARWGIQVPIMVFPAAPVRWVRVAAQVYNTLAQYEYLVEALRAEGALR